jgi:hypothetical protein
MITETYPLEQIVGAGMWFLTHMQEIDPTIDYVRAIHTDGHEWKLYEIHETHFKKTGFFSPKANLKAQGGGNKQAVS